MTREEVQILLQMLKTAYPTQKVEDPKAMVQLWASMLYDMPKEIVFTATKAYIGSHKFFPTIAEIRTQAEKFRGMAPRAVHCIEAPSKPIEWDNRGCQLCPFLKDGQREPCEICIY